MVRREYPGVVYVGVHADGVSVFSCQIQQEIPAVRSDRSSGYDAATQRGR